MPNLPVESAEPLLTSEVAQAADFSIIRYSQSWEDPLCLQQAMPIDENARILSIAAAGDNSFALLAMGAGSVVSVDLNPAQCALVELKRAAILTLTHEQFVRFLGAAECTGDEREGLYVTVREALPDDAREYWDAHPDAIADGVLHMGKLENMWRMFRSRVLPIMHGRSTVESAFIPRSAEQRRTFWDDRFANRRLKIALRLFFSQPVIARTGRDPAFFKHVKIEAGVHYRERARHAFVELDPSTNPFMQYIMLGRYLNLSTGHPYLDPANFELLRGRMDRLEVHCAELESFLGSCEPDSFTGFNLSDIFEWMSDDLYERMLRAIVRVGAPGAKLAYWNNLVERSRPDSMADLLSTDRKLSQRIHASDRAFLYRDFHVETVR